ncbi:MAG: hypothetical protein C4519_25930 [Desulfobacteraceae bacterium]|nr:MAG: hypothetical protein C4519_25930 [Desulfobacteraceae bacterium]
MDFFLLVLIALSLWLVVGALEARKQRKVSEMIHKVGYVRCRSCGHVNKPRANKTLFHEIELVCAQCGSGNWLEV